MPQIVHNSKFAAGDRQYSYAWRIGRAELKRRSETSEPLVRFTADSAASPVGFDFRGLQFHLMFKGRAGAGMPICA